MSRDFSSVDIENNADGDNHDHNNLSGPHLSIRGRNPLRRNSVQNPALDNAYSDRHGLRRSYNQRPDHRTHIPLNLFGSLGRRLCLIFVSAVFFTLLLVAKLHHTTDGELFNYGISEVRIPVSHRVEFGTTPKFVPGNMSRRLFQGEGLDQKRLQKRIGLRKPVLALIVGNLKKDSQSLMLITLMKSLEKLGYLLKVYTIENGNAHASSWQQIDFQVSVLDPEQHSHIDWSIFEGVIVESLNAKNVISSLMKEPFRSVPIIWIIQESTVSNLLFRVYRKVGMQNDILQWRSAFTRANVVVFPDFSLAMIYSMLDTGNFYVNPGSPIDVLAAESYSRTHEKHQLRNIYGLTNDDLVVLVLGSSFFYNEQAWDHDVEMRTIEPLLKQYAGSDSGTSFKFFLLCGNAPDANALQEVHSRLELHDGSVRHYSFSDDANGLLLVSDIVVYGSSQDEQNFPSLLIRAMAFGIPVLAPDIPIVSKTLTSGFQRSLFKRNNPDALKTAFYNLIFNQTLSQFALAVASSGRVLAKNMLATECVTGFARILENMLSFPSEVFLPDPSSQLQKTSWQWNLFDEIEDGTDGVLGMDFPQRSSIQYDDLEDELGNFVSPANNSKNGSEEVVQDIPTEVDWEELREVESFEEYERLETEQIEERMDKYLGNWDDVHRIVKKSEKVNFETNERDEGELERTGQPLCIYEIYDGVGAWPFLHNGSLYRGLSLYRKERRLVSDDIDALRRLTLLNDIHYRGILCELGGMFSIANKVDDIHQRPWIGFQSWHATARKVSLSSMAENVLEETIRKEPVGDVIYFWVRLDLAHDVTERVDELTFWSICDILNGGHCRSAFEDAFRKMYGLPLGVEALPPMPLDGGYWSAMHSWLMPTPSFLEFIMFSRMFVDSLDALHTNSGEVNNCLLGFSEVEKKHCYCRVLEVLVNVWAYHSARKMVYVEPNSGSMKEEHPIEERKGYMWTKYLNYELLKSMDEDLAEAADDKDPPREKWLWPLTGEVHWQGIYERERADRYRIKMDKKRRIKEKLLQRMKYGKKQNPLK